MVSIKNPYKYSKFVMKMGVVIFFASQEGRIIRHHGEKLSEREAKIKQTTARIDRHTDRGGSFKTRGCSIWPHRRGTPQNEEKFIQGFISVLDKNSEISVRR